MFDCFLACSCGLVGTMMRVESFVEEMDCLGDFVVERVIKSQVVSKLVERRCVGFEERRFCLVLV